MLSITDPTIKRLILEHLVEQLDSGDDQLDELLRGGVDPELLDMLRHRGARDFIQAASLESLRISAVFDNAAAIGAFRRIDAIRRDTELREYFVRHGASMSMLSDMFKLSREQAKRLRSLLVPDDAHFGAPKLPPVSDRQAIHEAWAVVMRSTPDAPTRERVFQLHQQFPQFSIAALWTTLYEFDPAPSKSQSR